jgi:hypothetical protein
MLIMKKALTSFAAAAGPFLFLLSLCLCASCGKSKSADPAKSETVGSRESKLMVTAGSNPWHLSGYGYGDNPAGPFTAEALSSSDTAKQYHYASDGTYFLFFDYEREHGTWKISDDGKSVSVYTVDDFGGTPFTTVIALGSVTASDLVLISHGTYGKYDNTGSLIHTYAYWRRAFRRK